MQRARIQFDSTDPFPDKELERRSLKFAKRGCYLKNDGDVTLGSHALESMDGRSCPAAL